MTNTTITSYEYDSTAAKVDVMEGTIAQQNYVAQLQELLDNCRNLVEIAENKRQALWIFHAVLKSIAGTVNYYNRVMKVCDELAENETATESVLRGWLERKERVEGFEKFITELYYDFGDIYDKQVIDYTEDNLGNLTQRIPLSDEILTNNDKPRQQGNTATCKQLRAALKFKG